MLVLQLWRAIVDDVLFQFASGSITFFTSFLQLRAIIFFH